MPNWDGGSTGGGGRTPGENSGSGRKSGDRDKRRKVEVVEKSFSYTGQRNNHDKDKQKKELADSRQDLAEARSGRSKDRRGSASDRRELEGLLDTKGRRSNYTPDVVDHGFAATPNDPYSLSESPEEKQKELDSLKEQLRANGIEPTRYADTRTGTYKEAGEDFKKAYSDLTEAVTDEYEENGLNSLAGVMEGAVQRPEILSELNLSDEEKSAVVRDLAYKQNNGLLSKVMNFAPVPGLGAAVNGYKDAKQANQYSKDIFNHERSTSDSFADGMGSFGRNIITGGLASMGPVGMAGAGLLSSAMAPSIGNFGKPVSPENNDNSDKDKNSIANINQSIIPPNENGLAATDSTGWDSSFGNYDSHVKGFKYTPNTAYSAWS